MTDVTMAAFHAYGTPSSAKHVIHVASPDLRTVKTLDEALAWLTKAYKNVFAEFERQSGRTLRLLPLSSGEFVGKFEKNIHELTAPRARTRAGHDTPNKKRRPLSFCARPRVILATCNESHRDALCARRPAWRGVGLIVRSSSTSRGASPLAHGESS